MAITKERLEELIKEGATIWSSYRLNYNVIAVNLTDKKRFVIYTDDMSILDRDTEYTYQLKNLFETRKEAEWHLKYHATRTEELNLPTWEEFMQFSQQRPCYNITFMEGRSKYICFLDKTQEEGMYICLYDKTFDEDIFCELATEENYIKVCDLCIKLFKGEQDVTNN